MPEIFNSDQGSQFTSKAFTERLKARSIPISMDGRGNFSKSGGQSANERIRFPYGKYVGCVAMGRVGTCRFYGDRARISMSVGRGGIRFSPRRRSFR
jgi:transposase InsO family protein